MTEPYNVGIKEVLAAVEKLSDQLTAFTSTTAVDIALLKDHVSDLKAEREIEKARRWQLHLALIGAFVAIALGVAGIIFK